MWDMKKKMILLCSLLLFFASCSSDVYVCMGGYARRYHKSKSCKGLRNCGGIVQAMTKEEAQNMFKTPCHICYNQKERAEQYDKE